MCALQLASVGLSVAGPMEVDVLTFNIRYDNPDDGENAWPERRAMVGAWLKAEMPDVVGLQEALRHQIDDIREAVPAYAEFGVGRDDGRRRGEYCAILYDAGRFGIDETDRGTFWLSDTPGKVGSKSWGNWIPRICTWARLVEKGTLRGLYVFNTHWDHKSQPSREGAASLIAKRIAGRARRDEPVVLMGDFNAAETNPAIRALRAGTPGLVDTFRVLHPDERAVRTFHGFRGGAVAGGKIDGVFVPPGGVEVLAAEIVRYQRDGRYLSDHFPVRARLRFR